MLITAERVVADRPGGPELLTPGTVRLEDGMVAEVHPGRDTGADATLPDGLLVPGLIDLQVNGYYGVDFVEAARDDWAAVLRRLPETGVTSLLPTFITAPVPTLAAALRRGAAVLSELTCQGGARPLGVHVEGPFLSARRRGAHNEAWLCDPDSEAVTTLLEAAPDLCRMVTVAPERAGALDAVRRIAAAGVLVSLGHSDATARQAAAGAAAGARSVTHLFNGQHPLHHREPGLPGRALVDPRLCCGLIADLHHVAADACRLAFAAAHGRVYLVTDAVAAAGMEPGTYVLGGDPITVADYGQPPLRGDGTLAGSGLRMDDAIGNMIGIGIDAVSAVGAATRVPADLIGRSDLGRIAPGATADLTWLSEGSLRARATWVGGELAYAAAPIGKACA